MSFRDRIDTLSRAELTGLAVVLVVTLAGAGLWYARSLPKPVELAEMPAATPAGGSIPFAEGSIAPAVSGSAAPAASGVPMIVDVTGHVRRPGVYEFPPGSRVIDAIERAGGPRDGALLSALNLAAPLTDGQQIVVPREGEVVAGAVPGTVPFVPGAVPGAEGPLVNINTADATALEALPGVGEVLAASIVAYRTEQGPFTSIDQLEDVSGIGPSTLEEIRPHATV